jgi:hypothetical protein
VILIMNALSLIRFGWLGFVVFAAAITGQTRELELTGAYEDSGTTITAAPGQSPQDVVSLHALLSAEFVPGLARMLHERTSLVKMTHTVGSLEIEVLNRDDEVDWRASWKQGTDYALRGDRLMLRFRPGRFGQDEFLLLLETITAHRLLQVEVQRLKPTFFGPVAQPMGTYLFHRAE